MQQLADQAAARSLELKGVEEELQLVVDKEKQLDAKMQEVAALQIELEKVKQHSAQENDLVKKELTDLAKDKKALKERNKSLQEKNKSIAKNHRGSSLSLGIHDCRRVEFFPFTLILILCHNHRAQKVVSN